MIKNLRTLLLITIFVSFASYLQSKTFLFVKVRKNIIQSLYNKSYLPLYHILNLHILMKGFKNVLSSIVCFISFYVSTVFIVSVPRANSTTPKRHEQFMEDSTIPRKYYLQLEQGHHSFLKKVLCMISLMILVSCDVVQNHIKTTSIV